MIRFVVLCLIATISSLALATSGFHRPGDLPVRPEKLDRAVAASVRVGDCSGVVLSPEGYVATNLHCVDQCLQPTYDFQPEIAIERGAKAGSYRYLKILEQVPSRLNCPAHVLNQFTIHEFGLSRPEVVWLGRGRHSMEETTITRWSEDEYANLTDLTEDIAILKYSKADGRDIPCLPLSAQQPAAGATIWTIGFPSAAARDFPSTAHEEFVSLGQMRSSVREDPILRQYAETLPTTELGLYWKRLAGTWERPHLSLTSVDAVHGNSGGMMIDAQGKLFAFLFSSTKSSNDTYTDATVVGVKAHHVRDELARFLGENQAAEVFGCPDPKN